ncbi:putative C6 transcription factor [Xylariaceae sp. FL1651]|nr:putative C6 transcription factor [Xylariaceae sp. FL1651]
MPTFLRHHTMERTRTGTGNSSTYGQACMQCYKAKCRCVPSSNGTSCERCQRLKKECQPSDSVRRRIGQRAEESDIRIAQLESKLETLLSAMQTIVNSSGSSVNLDQLLSENNISSSTSNSTGILTNSTDTNSSISEELTPATETSPKAPQHTNPFSPSPPDISLSQAEECFDFFRSRMLPCFPFIDLTPDITAWQLHQDRPFLFQAILTITTFSTQKKLARAEDLKRLLVSSALITVQSSIDLLLGLLTYLAWSTDAFLGGADLVSRLMMLAVSLVYDLRLFKPSQPDVQLLMTITQGGTREYDLNASEETVQSLMEKQRALLACFILSSNVSSHLGRQDALRWTPQMEEACRAIEKNSSSPKDEMFAFQVRLHVLKQRAAYIREQHETDRARTLTASVTASIPGLLYLKTLREQLHELRSSFPPDLYQKETLIMYAEYVELYINHLAYSISFDSPPLNLSGQRSDGGLLPGFERLACLWRSVECIKSWLDNFYKIPPSELVGLPFHFWSQMILCITVLKYLSVLGDPAWDCQAVRNTVDLISTMDWMVQKLDLASKEPSVQCDDNLFKLLSRLLYKCREWANGWWNMVPQIPDVGVDSGVTSGSHIPDLDQMVWMQSMDLENDQWLESVLGESTAFS